MENEIYVTASFKSLEDKTEEMITVLSQLANQTRAEEGCIEYGYYQADTDRTRFTSIERWANAEVEAAHWQTGHLKAALARLPQLLDGDPEITKYNKIA